MPTSGDCGDLGMHLSGGCTEVRSGQQAQSARLQDGAPSLCPVVVHVVPCSAGMWDPGTCPSLELGSTSATALRCHQGLQSPTSSTVWLCCSPAVRREKGRGHGRGFPWGIPQSLEHEQSGEWGRGKLHSRALAELQRSLHLGQVRGKRLEGQTGFPSHKCQLCHAAQPHTQTCSTGTPC